MADSSSKSSGSANAVTSKIISKDTVKRLLSDVKAIMKNPLVENGIYYIHDDTDMMKGYAMIVGPEETPYFGGFYFFRIVYPTDYPHTPPMVTYFTNGDGVRFNPNLYKCGKVCISILNTWRGEQWTSCQTISTMLLTLCTLLCKDPLLNEPGVNRTHTDFDNYTKIIEYKNIDIGIVSMMTKKKSVYPVEFDMFYPYMKELFLKNKEKIVNFLQERENVKETITTSMYSMTISIDYAALLCAFKKIAQN
jgi:ubiquitin-conjugating enzyme E2 Z